MPFIFKGKDPAILDRITYHNYDIILHEQHEQQEAN